MTVTEAPCLLPIFNKRDVSIVPKTAKQFGNTPEISRRWTGYKKPKQQIYYKRQESDLDNEPS